MARRREFNNQRRDSDGEEYLDMHVEHITKGFLFFNVSCRSQERVRNCEKKPFPNRVLT